MNKSGQAQLLPCLCDMDGRGMVIKERRVGEIQLVYVIRLASAGRDGHGGWAWLHIVMACNVVQQSGLSCIMKL